jgi:hypothetical protein
MNVVRCKAASRIVSLALSRTTPAAFIRVRPLSIMPYGQGTMIMSMDIAPCAGTVSGATCGREIEGATKAKQM